MKPKQILLISFILLGSFFVNAEIKMPAIFTDNMVLQRETEVSVWGWANAKSSVTVSTSWNGKSYETNADKEGKWKLKIQTPEAGGPYEMDISDGNPLSIKNILIGEVWLCSGQSNMEMPVKGFRGQPVTGSNMAILKSKNQNIRLVTVPRNPKANPVDDFEGKWDVAGPSTVSDFSATGYFFGRLLEEIIDVPVGLICVSYSGSCIQAWMSKESAFPFEETGIPRTDEDIKDKSRTPVALFNGMLNPVVGYGIRGAIWYQGETNYKEPELYMKLFPNMVSEWRTLWGIGEFPFYYCQIAPFDYSAFTPTDWKEEYNSAYFREAQLKCADIIPNSGMAVLMDCANATNIHPPEKHIAGERLALIALVKTYGLKGFGYESPTYNGMEISGSTVTISFNNVPNGITSFDEEITTFEIAGEDKVFYPATVFKRSKSLIVSSPRVQKPVAVRYAFKDAVKGQLFSAEGLPVSSFRTDDW